MLKSKHFRVKYVFRSINSEADSTFDELADLNVKIQEAQLEYDISNF